MRTSRRSTRARRHAALAGGLAAAMAVPATPALAYRFGDFPLLDAFVAADSYKRLDAGCKSAEDNRPLTQSKLVALMVSASIAETGCTATQTPSPMTVGRGDRAPWYNPWGTSCGRDPRAWWETGWGLYQLDTLVSWTPDLKMNSSTSAQATAQEMARKFCSGNKTPEAAWQGTWAACDGGACRTIYNSIYDKTNDRLVNVTSESVDRLGGAEYHTCRYKGDASGFICTYINFDLAQPASSASQYWRSSPGGSCSGITPLALPHYSFTNGGAEVRSWFDINVPSDPKCTPLGPIGYDGSTANPHGGINWSNLPPCLGFFSWVCDRDWNVGPLLCYFL